MQWKIKKEKSIKDFNESNEMNEYISIGYLKRTYRVNSMLKYNGPSFNKIYI